MNCPICEVKLIGHRDYLYCPKCQCNYYPKAGGTLSKDEIHREGIIINDTPEMFPQLREREPSDEPTPRTDQHLKEAGAFLVDPEFCRGLERELAALKERRSRCSPYPPQPDINHLTVAGQKLTHRILIVEITTKDLEQKMVIAETKIANLEQELKGLRSQLLG